MSFITMRGQGPDNRIDNTNKFVQDIHNKLNTRIESLNSRIDTVVEISTKLSEQIKTLQEQQEYTANVVHSLNRDVKKLESKPDPVIPLMPDLTPMRSEVKLIRTVIDEVISSHHDEMTELWKNLQEIHRVRNDLTKKIDAIKIPSHARIYGTIAFLAALIGILAYV